MQTRTNYAITGILVLAYSLLGGLALRPTGAQAAPRDLGPLTPLPGPKLPFEPRRRITCMAPTGAGTQHGDVTMAETWTAAASPHILLYDTNISAPVTIEPCAIVRIAANKTITIKAGGAIIAVGANGFPVIIEALVPGAAWTTIRNFGGTLSLAHAIVRDGGAAPSASVTLTGALQMQIGGTAVGRLYVEDVDIVNSRSQGVYITGTTGFDPKSQNLRVYGSVSYPVQVYASMVGTIPTGNYTGNGVGNSRDAIAITAAASGGPVLVSQTMYFRGVPYHIGTGQADGQLDVRALGTGTQAMLTIEPGVIIQFPTNGSLNVNADYGGMLVALAADKQRIVFTSDKGPASAPGDWLGVRFIGSMSPRSVLTGVRVEFAGRSSPTGSNSCPYPGATINDAAIRILGPATSQFITESEIAYSAHHGIDRGWTGGALTDFMATNTFSSVLQCKQTLPRSATGVCPQPANVPCP